MTSKSTYENVAGLLYLVPFAVSGGYALYLWVRSGISAVLPTSAYLTVTRDPYVFIAGSLAVMLAVVLDLVAVEPANRPSRVEGLVGTLQNIAVASLVLALLMAWYANGFLDVAGAANDFLVGRFSIVFPALLVLLSYLISARFKMGSLQNPKVIAMIAMLLVPVVVYEAGKRDLAVGLGSAIALIVVALVLFLRNGRKAGSSTEA